MQFQRLRLVGFKSFVDPAEVHIESGLTGIVGPSVLYGKFVEFGTRHMGARPYMRPAAEQVLPKFAAAVKRALGGFH